MGMRLLHFLAMASILLGVSCASRKSDVNVRVYHLKSVQRLDVKDKEGRSEQQKRLRGAIEESEMEARKGQYYMVDWDVRQYAIEEPIRVVFSYHQSATGGKKLKMEQMFAQSETKGRCEFAIVGESYQIKGRVLDWRVDVYSGASLLVSEQSYLWE